MVVGGTVVVTGRVVGGGVVVEGGTTIDVVLGGSVVVGSSSTVVGGDVVAGGGLAVVPGDRGAVVATLGWVVPVNPDGMVATVVDDESTVEEVELDVELDDVVAPDPVVVVTPAVLAGDWLAVCRRGDSSDPVATSKRRAAMDSAAMAYRPTLKR
ncbi:MAG: hypothetical protein ACRD1D_09255 [Acidimicrobiales bacterium]